jgi:glycosyltransferase involved in cell wall biosynthesis
MSEGKLNILFIAKWFPHPEDAQFGVFTLKHAHAASLFNNVYVLHICPLEVDEVKLVNDSSGGITILRLEYPQAWNIFQKTTKLTTWIKKATNQLKNQFGPPDVVHCHILGSPVLIARHYFPKTPFVVSEHWTGFINGYFAKMPHWKQLWFRTSTSNAALTTVPSENLKRVMQQTHNFSGRFEVLPNVIEIPEDMQVNAPPSHVKAIVVADLHEHNKNITGLLQAWDAIKLPEGSELLIAGDGQDREMLEKLSRSMKLEEKGVAFCGRLHNEEVFEALSSSSFLVVNSHFETFSMVTAEALAAGLPVLATRCGGPEQFVDKSNGVLIDKNKPQQLQDGLLRMIERTDDFNRQQISNEFRQKFSAGKVGQLMTEFYKQATNND